jgi:hypothetical protein
MAEALRSNIVLAPLRLSRNSIGTKDVAKLAEALHVNTALERLDLSGNSIGHEGDEGQDWTGSHMSEIICLTAVMPIVGLKVLQHKYNAVTSNAITEDPDAIPHKRSIDTEDLDSVTMAADLKSCIWIIVYVYLIPRIVEEIILCHCYIDDIIFGTNSPELRAMFVQHLWTQWSITDDGVMSRFLGIHFHRSADGRTWEMSMVSNIDKTVKRFNLEDTRPAPVPIASDCCGTHLLPAAGK